MSAAPPTPRTESAQTLSLSVGWGKGTRPTGIFIGKPSASPLRFTPTKNQKAGDLQTKSSALFGRKINEKVLLTVPSIAAGY